MVKGGWLWANIYSFFLLVGCLLCSRWSRGSRVPRAPTWVLRCRIPGPRYSGEATLRATWRLESINLCPSLPHPSCVLSSRSSHVVAWLFTRAPSPRSRMRLDLNIALAQRSTLCGRLAADRDLARVGLRWWGGPSAPPSGLQPSFRLFAHVIEGAVQSGRISGAFLCCIFLV